MHPRPRQMEPAQGQEDLARLVSKLEAIAAGGDPDRRGTSAVLLAKLRPQLDAMRAAD